MQLELVQAQCNLAHRIILYNRNNNHTFQHLHILSQENQMVHSIWFECGPVASDNGALPFEKAGQSLFFFFSSEGGKALLLLLPQQPLRECPVEPLLVTQSLRLLWIEPAPPFLHPYTWF